MATRLQMTDINDARPEPSSEDASHDPYANMRVVDADALFAGDREVLIRNGNDFYRLRRTRQGKLILNK